MYYFSYTEPLHKLHKLCIFVQLLSFLPHSHKNEHFGVIFYIRHSVALIERTQQLFEYYISKENGFIHENF